MAAESLPQWQALSSISGLPIFIPCGILFFFPTEEPYVAESIAAHRQLGLPTDVLNKAEMARRFPMIDFDGISIGLHEPGFGALMARRSVQTLVDRFVRDGGTLIEGFVEPPGQTAMLSEIRLASARNLIRASGLSPQSCRVAPSGPVRRAADVRVVA